MSSPVLFTRAGMKPSATGQEPPTPVQEQPQNPKSPRSSFHSHVPIPSWNSVSLFLTTPCFSPAGALSTHVSVYHYLRDVTSPRYLPRHSTTRSQISRCRQQLLQGVLHVPIPPLPCHQPSHALHGDTCPRPTPGLAPRRHTHTPSSRSNTQLLLYFGLSLHLPDFDLAKITFFV